MSEVPEPIRKVSLLTPDLEHEHVPVVKPEETLFRRQKRVSFLPSTSNPNSLNRLMSLGSSMKAVHTAYVEEARRTREQKKEPSSEDYGYGYGYGPDEDEPVKKQCAEEEPPNKRRRFQRRNSKTPAMLMAMHSPLLLHLDFLEDKKEEAAACESPSTSTPSLDSWDGGLEIAEELVMHLQKRRESNA